MSVAMCTVSLGVVHSAGALNHDVIRSSTAAPSFNSWGGPIADAALRKLNVQESATVSSISCPAAGECTAVGAYEDWHYRGRPFILEERAHVWQPATLLPGFLGLDVGWRGGGISVSCPSVGNCGVAGSYGDARRSLEVFVDNEVHGVWGRVRPLPGFRAANGNDASVAGISCAAQGSCETGGSRWDPVAMKRIAFLSAESHGSWQPKQDVAGLTSLDSNVVSSQIDSVSCTTPQHCTAAGELSSNSGASRAFVVDMTGGTWGPAELVPGLTALSAGHDSGPTALSCASPGNCAIAGWIDDSIYGHSFVADEAGGVWGAATSVGGVASPASKGSALGDISCASAGFCEAAGSYWPVANTSGAFVVKEVAGVWQPATVIGGLRHLPLYGTSHTTVSAISCPRVGSCAVAGDYSTNLNGFSAFLAVESKGTWGAAQPVPGERRLNGGMNTGLSAIACSTVEDCVAGGGMNLSGVHWGGSTDAFVDNFGPHPVVRSLSSTSGPARGDRALIVFGTHLDGTLAVWFGHHRALATRLVSPGAVRVIVPAGTGVVAVTVTTITGTTTTSPPVRYRYK